MRWELRAAIALYRLAVRTWPREFRRRSAAPATQAFADACRRDLRHRGVRGVAARTAADLVDALRVGVLERWPSRAPIATAPSVSAAGTLIGPRSPGIFEKMTNIWSDVRFAFRSLRNQPTFSAIAIATLAVAIGANTVMFSVVKLVILNPLPYPDSDRLVSLASEHVETGLANVSAADLASWRQQSRTVASMAGYMYWGYTFTEGETPLDVPSMRVEPALFDVLGVEAHLGRTFRPEDGVYGNEPVAVVSHEFWRAELGGDDSVVGRRLVLDGAPHTVVGVMQQGFEFPPDTENGFWTAIAWNPETLNERRGQRSAMVIGRLSAAATVAQAQEEINGIAARLGEEFPDTNGLFGARARSAHDVLVPGAEGAEGILILFAGVGFLLLIACTNVANLMLARLTARDREMSVRVALGAGRLHLARQLLSETLLLAAAGGTLGTVLAVWGIDALRSMSQLPLEGLDHLRLDGGVLLFTLLLTLSVGIVFGLVPARRSGRWAVGQALKETAGSTVARGTRRTLNALVVGEVALALVLLIGAGLMARTFAQLTAADVGFRHSNLLTMNVFIPETLYPEDHDKAAFYRDVAEEVRAIPGVVSAGVVSAVPMDHVGIDFSLPYEVVGREQPASGPPRAQYRVASSGYFETVAIPLLRGRVFGPGDREDGPRVMLINETLARREFADEDPIGESLSIPIGGPHEIVGVVRDIRHNGMGLDPSPELYVPLPQNPFGGMVVVARTGTDPLAYVEPLKEAVFRVDPKQPVYATNTMDNLIATNVAFPRLNMIMSALFAAVALLLAAIGIYGVIAYAVTQRTREIGLRMALGARSRDTVRTIVGRSMGITMIGITLGLVAALVLTRFLQSQLFGVGTMDPLVFGGVALLFFAVTLLASYLPARRATRVDPLIALRAENE